MPSALLVAQRGVVCKSPNLFFMGPANLLVFRKQHTMTIEQQRDIGRHFGPLHRHPTYAVPRRGDLDDVVGESHDRQRTLLIFSGLLRQELATGLIRLLSGRALPL